MPDDGDGVVLPTRAEIETWIHDQNNGGRWGPDDQLEGMNLVTPDKRRQAVALVTDGQPGSLSRPFPVDPGPANSDLPSTS